MSTILDACRRKLDKKLQQKYRIIVATANNKLQLQTESIFMILIES
jgi:hypothetical protein